MRIIEITIGEISIPLKSPFVTALRKVTEVSSVIVKVTTNTGHVGYGEAPCTAQVTGDTKGSIGHAILQHIKPNIMGMEIADIEKVMHRIDKSMRGNSSAKAAVDIAIYDLYGQLYNAPVYQLLGGHKKELLTDLTISIGEVDTMIEESRMAISQGFHVLKIKCGSSGLDDIEKIKKISAAIGSKVKLRIDANQGWGPKESVRIIKTLEDAGVNMELVEQPVAFWDYRAMAYIAQNVTTPIAADESIFTPRQAVDLLNMGGADIINIKLMKTGGIHNALKICAVAEAYGVECMIGSMLESNLSVSAAAHLAGAKRIITKIDLDTPLLCQTDAVYGSLKYIDDRIKIVGEVGMGFNKFNTNVVEI